MDEERRVRGLPALRRLYDLIGRINASRDLAATLQAVVDGVVEGLDFGIAAVNSVRDDGTYEVVAVAGSEEARAALLGTREPPETWTRELARAEHWGALRFVPHQRLDPDEDPPGYVPDFAVPGGPDAWHPLDALYAPLLASSGEIVGMLSVDLPADLCRPSPLQRELLEMFAAQAGIAIDNARLHEQLTREQARLRASEESFRLAFDGAGVGMCMIDLRDGRVGEFLRVNAAMCRILGYSDAELRRRTVFDVVSPAERTAVERARDQLVQVSRAPAAAPYRDERRCLHADGHPLWVSVTVSVIRSAAGEPLYAITQVEDITERKATDLELARRALQDPLTGLANRVALQQCLGAAIDRARRSGRSGAVLFCDLDGFKEVNDALGHDAGDDVLATVAHRLAAQVRADDSVVRFGGDEFVVLAQGVTRREVERLAERIERAVVEPVDHDGHRVQVSVSIGIAMLSEGTTDPHRLVREADIAMYRAKAEGRNRHAFSAADDGGSDRPRAAHARVNP